MKFSKVILTIQLMMLTILVNLVYAIDVSGNVTKSIDDFASKINSIFSNIGNLAVTKFAQFVSSCKVIIAEISKIASVLLAVVGAFIWFSGLSPYKGKRMIISSLLLFMFSYVISMI